MKEDVLKNADEDESILLSTRTSGDTCVLKPVLCFVFDVAVDRCLFSMVYADCWTIETVINIFSMFVLTSRFSLLFFLLA